VAHQIEYWLPIKLQPIANEQIELYLAQLNEIWQAKLVQIAPMIQENLDKLDVEYVFMMRHQSNTLPYG
jgi:hypothetical protein